MPLDCSPSFDGQPMDSRVPWWAWALITWCACLAVCLVAFLVTPSGLWKVPPLNEKIDFGNYPDTKCNECSELTDQLYMAVNRPDQCEAPHYRETVPCVL